MKQLDLFEADKDKIMVPKYNLEPVIIDSKGWYLTRAGLRVHIEQIDEDPSMEVTAFKCKGHLTTPRKGKADKVEWNIWHRSGHFSGFDDPLDIIKKE